MRLRFEELSFEQEGALVQAMFSRADAWTHLEDGREPDRPLSSFREVIQRGLGGVVEMLGMRTPKPRLAPFQVASAVGGHGLEGPAASSLSPPGARR